MLLLILRSLIPLVFLVHPVYFISQLSIIPLLFPSSSFLQIFDILRFLHCSSLTRTEHICNSHIISNACMACLNTSMSYIHRLLNHYPGSHRRSSTSFWFIDRSLKVNTPAYFLLLKNPIFFFFSFPSSPFFFSSLPEEWPTPSPAPFRDICCIPAVKGLPSCPGLFIG